ncbi:MAG: flagellar biosynthesis protein FlgA, partial [Burkholderiales bacterium]
MSLHAQLQQRAAEGKPIRVGLIGAGKFGSMYLAQVPRTPGVHLVGIAD